MGRAGPWGQLTGIGQCLGSKEAGMLFLSQHHCRIQSKSLLFG